MPSIMTHLEIVFLFSVIFGVGSIVWDFDHLTKCSSKNVLAAAISGNNDQQYNAENQAKGGCRGFTHSLAFAIAFTALYLAYVIHMIMDTKGGVGI